jgi:glycine betaine/proline transport system substrate-binding protein
MKRVLAILLAVMMMAAACGDDDSSDTAAEPAAGDDDSSDTADEPADSADKATITLVINPWTASALNAHVAAQLIESELGNPTELINIDEQAMFAGLADGTLDVVLEIWPSSITDIKQAFFDDGTINDIGSLGAIGKIGWFVPQYVIDEYPEMATYEGLSSDVAAEYFGTAETGDLGRFLATDPSYSQYDALLIENLGLPFEVIYSGSEPATVAELDSKASAGEGIILYWWTPTAAVGEYDLVNVALPEFTTECGATSGTPDADVTCDYPEETIFKAASAALADKDADVYAFFEAFTITNADQLEMLPSAEIDGEDPADVAAAWIEAHSDVWSAWIP